MIYEYSGELGSCHHVVSMGVETSKRLGFADRDNFNGMDCMCVDVYFHERREILDHASGFISSNILDRVHAIFGSKFE